jgi:hypothetical protein
MKSFCFLSGIENLDDMVQSNKVDQVVDRKNFFSPREPGLDGALCDFRGVNQLASLFSKN